MRKLILFAVLAVVALNALGHAGEVHKYMGTVTTVHDDGSFMLEKTDGKTMHVLIAKSTAWQDADGNTVSSSALADGKRVVVTISTDGRTASLVKLATAKK